MTSTITATRELDRLAIPLGMDKHHEWLNLRLDSAQVENPGILILGGSRIGKTSLQVLLAAIAGSRGCIVIIIDPKQRFARAFRRPKTHECLPHVLVYSHPIPELAAREWAGIMQLVVHDQHLRYEQDGQSDHKLLTDLDRFPPVLIVVDELARALEFADKEWNERKLDDYKGDTPLRDWLHESAAMGAEAGHIDCWSNQTAGVHNFPKKNTDTRSLFGQRVVLGNLSEEEQKRSIFGPGVNVPTVPIGRKGAGNVAWERNKPMRFQAAYEDWEHDPERLYKLAALGIPRLRNQGHIDDLGRLQLAGFPVPRPGQMMTHVAPYGLDLVHTGTATSPESTDLIEDTGETTTPTIDHVATTDTPVADSVPRFITGNEEAAMFCGMSKDTFLTNRRRHSIPNTYDKAAGNKPGWWETDLAEWALYRKQNGRKNGNGEAA